jgi:hypothetical protein
MTPVTIHWSHPLEPGILLQEAIDEFNRVRQGFSSQFRDMLRPCLEELDVAIAPGETCN